MAERVLLIEDDQRLADGVRRYLEGYGVAVTVRPTAATGLRELERGDYDALLLDVMLPDGDGFEVCRQVRAGSTLPIIMLTARGEPTDRVVGLELGADDYLPKPFDPRELLARLRAVLRRARSEVSAGEQAGATRREEAVLRFGRLEIDEAARRVRVDGEDRPLTGYQLDLLLALARNAGRVMSREALITATRGGEHEAFDRSIDVHVSRLRAAIEDDPRRPRRILTLRGAGYLFASRQDEG